MNHLQLKMDLAFQTPLHITGDRRAWGADKALALSAKESYSIPASSLKGNLRYRAEALLRTWEQDICQSPEPGSMCHDPAGLCLVCRVFGNPRYRSVLKFGEARTLPNAVTPQIRSGVSISRFRRTSMEQRLFFVETAASDSDEVWTATAEGHFQNSTEAREAAALIYLAAKGGHAMGGGKSRGLGWVKSWNVQAILDGKNLSGEDLKPIWESWVVRKK